MVEFPYYSLPLTSAEVAKKLPRMHWLQLEDIKLAFSQLSGLTFLEVNYQKDIHHGNPQFLHV